MPRNSQESNHEDGPVRASTILNNSFDDNGEGDSTPSPDPLAIKMKSYYRIGKKTTICLITCECGLEIVGQSQVVDPADYNPKTGQRVSYENANSKRIEYKGVLNHVE